MAEHNSVHDKKAAFLAAIETWPSIRSACTAIGISRTSHYEWLRDDPEYVTAFEQAIKRGDDSLRDEAYERAQMRDRGEVMLIVMLKARFPNEFRERWSGELTGKDGEPLKIDVATVDALIHARRATIPE